MGLLKWAVILGIAALVLAMFGFTGIAEGVADIAKVLFFLFVALVFVLVLLGVFFYKSVT